MTVPYHSKNSYEFNPPYSYQRHFEVALVNLKEVIREERILKRMRKHRDKSQHN